MCQQKVKVLNTLMGYTGHEVISKYYNSKLVETELLPFTSSYPDSQRHSQLIPIA